LNKKEQTKQPVATSAKVPDLGQLQKKKNLEPTLGRTIFPPDGEEVQRRKWFVSINGHRSVYARFSSPVTEASKNCLSDVVK